MDAGGKFLISGLTVMVLMFFFIGFFGEYIFEEKPEQTKIFDSQEEYHETSHVDEEKIDENIEIEFDFEKYPPFIRYLTYINIGLFSLLISFRAVRFLERGKRSEMDSSLKEDKEACETDEDK